MSDLQGVEPAPPPSPIQAKLDVMRTARTVWRVFRQQPGPYIGLLFIPLIIAFPVQILIGIVQAAMRAAFGRPNAAAVVVTLLLAILGFIVQYGAQFTCQLAGLWGASRNMDGGRFDLGEAMRVGFSRLLAYAGIIVLTLLICLIGFLLLIIPGIVAAGFLALAPAACAIERRGPVESLKRSVALVRNNWWRSLGVFWLVIFLPILAFAAIVVALYLVFDAIGMKALTLIMILPAIPLFVIIGALGIIVTAVLFVEIRALKEGGVSGGVSGVFD